MKQISYNSISQENLTSIVNTIMKVKSSYKNDIETWKNRMFKIYENVTSFENTKRYDWETNFKYNELFRIENLWVSRLLAKEFVWKTNVREDAFDYEIQNMDAEQIVEYKKQLSDASSAVRDYLTNVMRYKGQKSKLKDIIRSMIRYGMAHVSFRYKYQKNDDGDRVMYEYPCIENETFSDVYFDPRYKSIETLPAFIINRRWIRIADLESNKNYINVDKLKNLPSKGNDDMDTYRRSIWSAIGIPGTDLVAEIDKNNLETDEFYGYLTVNWEEGLFKVVVVSWVSIIEIKKIKSIPITVFNCFKHPETYFSIGIAEPIQSIVDEMNFKANSKATYINKSLNREYVWNAESGIHPKNLISRPWNIIPTSKPVDIAMKNLQELKNLDINPSVFTEGQEMDRKLQNASYLIDTSSQSGNQALTNTATWSRIKFYESVSVINYVRDNIEQAMVDLAYKLLEFAYDNIEGNIVIKKTWDEGYWRVHKDFIKDALNRYDITIEAWSSTKETEEDRRNEALALYNILLWAKNAGVQVNLDEALKNVLNTFDVGDTKNRLLTPNIQLPWIAPTTWGEELKNENPSKDKIETELNNVL